MANIALLNYCNLRCPYCFANKFITEEEKELITIEQFDYILEFISRSKPSRIGLIGGEPTLHPKFEEIVRKSSEFCNERHTGTTIFSNGILLGDHVKIFNNKNVSCLINVNSPDIIGNNNWISIDRSIMKVKAMNALDQLNIGINLYPDLRDYSFILDLAKKYKFKSIRCSYVAPTCQYSNVNKKEYYTNGKELFMNFSKDAKDLGINIHIDCNHIPRCYFTNNELAELSNVSGWHSYCDPVIDISPDMKASVCFGAYGLVDISKFENLEEVERYFTYTKHLECIKANGDCGCSECEKYKNYSCQGGCLAFASKSFM